MIFAFNANGDLLNKTPSQVKQGSNRANTIFVIMPLPPSVVMEVSFTLPNGFVTPKIPMALATETGFLGLKDENDNTVFMWSYKVPLAITTYAGTVTAQFFVTNEDDTQNEVISSFSVDFEVLQGTAPTIPPVINSYQEIINAINQYNLAVLNNITELQGEIDEKQDKTDNNLNTTAKTVVGAINENREFIENIETEVDQIIVDRRGTAVFVNGEPVANWDADKKINKPDAPSQASVIVQLPNGTITQVQYGRTTPIAYTIPTYLVKGELIVGIPTADTHAVNKGYADSHYTAKSNTTSAVYGTNGSGNPIMLKWAANNLANALVLRNGNGNVSISEPLQDDHAANKKYVDEKSLYRQTLTIGQAATQVLVDASAHNSGTYKISFLSSNGLVQIADTNAQYNSLILGEIVFVINPANTPLGIPASVKIIAINNESKIADNSSEISLKASANTVVAYKEERLL